MLQNDVVTPDPAPRLSRRHAVAPGSARGLLFTVLGEFVLPGSRAAWTSAFIDSLGRLGVEEKATRQALMRTAADGWLQPERVGRRTRWALTPAADGLLTDGAKRIYGFRGVDSEWDGRWLIVLARTPETERPTRHLLRTRLTWAGLGSPAPGVWIGTHAGRLREVEHALSEAGMDGEAQIFLAEHLGQGDPAEIVAEAWDLAAVEAGYQDFITRFTDVSGTTPLATTIELVHAWRRFPWIDPTLPAQLLPTPWDGVAAAALFGAVHARLSAGAQGEWRELNETGD